jgi:thioredoxin-related protein
MRQLTILFVTTIFLLGNALVQPNDANALTQKNDGIIWQTSKDDAISLAQSEGKKVLLLAGRDTCGNTNYMKNTVCETTSPEIKSFIEQYYVPWYCDVDSDNSFWQYAAGLQSITLPLICIIDPDDSNNYIDQTTATQSPTTFYNRIHMAIFVPDATLSVTPSVIEVSELSGTTAIAIANTNTGTMNWEVIEDADWLTVSPVSGVDDQTLTVSYNTNSSFSRKATITISADYARNSPFDVTIIQASGPEVLKWVTSKEEAINLATNEGKKILLLAGRDTCGNTRYMQKTVCEKTSPNIKQRIQANFIPWYCDVDSNTEYRTYTDGLGGFTLPLICIINPLDSDNYIDRTTATQTAEDFLVRLQENSNQAPDEPSSSYPEDNANDISTQNTILTWDCSDSDTNDTLVYDIYMGITSNPLLVMANQSVSQYTPAELQHSVTYYWKVVARDNHGNETVGPIWQFTTSDICYSQEELNDAVALAEAAKDLIISEKDAIISEYETMINNCPMAYTVTLTEGWHMMSAINKTATPVTDPEGAISAMFEYNNGAYFPITECRPGRGFWVKINQECVFKLGSDQITR